MCYVVAHPYIWRSVFGISSDADIRILLEKWYSNIHYTGVHGGDGWTSDQHYLYDYIIKWSNYSTDFIYKTYMSLQFNHLDKCSSDWLYISDKTRKFIKTGRYKDFHMPCPIRYMKEIIAIYDYVSTP